MSLTAMQTKARYLAHTDEVFRNPDGSVFVGDFVKDGVLYRCRGESGLLDGGGLMTIQDGGHVEFWKDGKLHRPREEGPAVADLFGSYGEYWEHGSRIA